MMCLRRGTTRFAQEAYAHLVVVHRVVGEQLQRDIAIQAVVARLVHHAHAALSDLALDSIATDDVARFWLR